jgi:multicomponent Na+:H+ antiporter subunit G
MPEVVVDIAAGWATLLLFGGGLLLLRAPDTLHRVLDARRAVLMLLDIVGAALLALGLLLAKIGLYGLLRMPDIFHQLHPAGLVTGPAVILVLLASAASGSAEIITSAALVILFVLITSPLSTHAIAQAARRRPRREGDHPAQPTTSSDVAPRAGHH